jgi:glycosyltransferase involved in cell wall biosynthesis
MQFPKNLLTQNERYFVEKISVLIPMYNNEKTIGKAVTSVLMQRACDFEIVISDDHSNDNSVAVAKKFITPQVRLVEHYVNKGCGVNLNRAVAYARNDILYFLCGDDVLIDPFALARVSMYFEEKKLGIITRPYYWFTDSAATPVRVRPILFRKTAYTYAQSFDQISGIAMRKSKMPGEFSNKPFVEMASVAYPMSCRYPTLMLNNYSVAVRIGDNGATKPYAFLESPLRAWRDIVGKDKKLFSHFARNDIGLIQIKQWGTLRQLIREIVLMVAYYPLNLLRLKFWFFALGTLLTPRRALRNMVAWYRRRHK